MTEDELRSEYEEAKKMARDELKWRRKVFAQKPKLLAAKVVEMQRLLAILAHWKDALKPHCEPSLEQPTLIDLPQRQQQFE